MRSYDEAEELAYNSYWKTEECGNENCWCALITPVDDIKYYYGEANVEFIWSFVDSGAVNKRFAEYVVKMHNDKLDLMKNK